MAIFFLANMMQFLYFDEVLRHLPTNEAADMSVPTLPKRTTEPGILYLVATPIGNLEDITFRAVRILQEADLLAAEDTRRTRLLLDHYRISRALISYHDHNKESRSTRLLRALRGGKSVALVSDAGTPGISDPAYYLVRLAIQHDVPVVPIPGPASPIAALVISGLPPDRFVFEGFLPIRAGKRRSRLRDLMDEPRTIVLFESPHRLVRTLQDILNVLGDRPATVVRELTKKFEEVSRGTVSQLLRTYAERKPRGEIVIVLAGRPA
jgi:16S rRNA (cytidine1402-2'-O)-methyltransferase